ncbi:uncharacterized protein LOC132066537 [Lycium ferocissimum]|uniref:uncharacterized protein LOC132066537 n=1 Tax=Lycium ferocissimum TaxID=112874 RepID=UPI002816733A|nr:uncharacterized protein LOC132066537 [Lycium ferocissimum]
MVSEFTGGQRQQHPRYSYQPAGSAPLRFDRSSYSKASQSSRASGSQYRPESSQMRPPLPRCTQCGKLHAGQCQLGSDGCYTCGQSGHRIRECPMGVGIGVAQPTGSVAGSSSAMRPSGQVFQTPAGRGRGMSGASSSSGPQHRVYALAGRQARETSPDIVTGILSVFSHDVCALIDPGSTLSYVTPFVAGKFRLEPELIKPFEVSAPVGDSRKDGSIPVSRRAVLEWKDNAASLRG